jgi:L-iditol 2-dehydrogenase
VAKAVGAGRVMITGRETAVKSRFRVAEEIGAFDYILNVEREDPIEAVKKATGGRGADIILDTTGNAEAMRQAFQMIGRAGVIKVVGIGDQIVEVPWGRMMSEVVKIHFCRGATHSSFEKFCSLASTGRLKLKPILSNAFPLEEWRRGFQSIESRDSVKVLLIP